MRESHREGSTHSAAVRLRNAVLLNLLYSAKSHAVPYVQPPYERLWLVPLETEI